MYIMHNLYFFAVVISVVNIRNIVRAKTDDEISAKLKEFKDEKIDKENENFEQTERRFLEELEDDEWHVAHLKDTDFNSRRSGCREETFEEQVKRYRSSLKNDGALVNYVSSDAIPVNETELKDRPCKIEDVNHDNKVKLRAEDSKQNINATTVAAKTEVVNTAKATENTKQNSQSPKETKPVPSEQSPKAKENIDNEKEIHTATTQKIKASHNDTDAGRRASEYLFSSVEYYDETVDFADTICPDAVEVILLEQDIIRAYDVECELTLEWRSLE